MYIYIYVHTCILFFSLSLSLSRPVFVCMLMHMSFALKQAAQKHAQSVPRPGCCGQPVNAALRLGLRSVQGLFGSRLWLGRFWPPNRIGSVLRTLCRTRGLLISTRGLLQVGRFEVGSFHTLPVRHLWDPYYGSGMLEI